MWKFSEEKFLPKRMSKRLWILQNNRNFLIEIYIDKIISEIKYFRKLSVSKFRFFDQNFDFLTKISIFWSKFRFFDQNFNFLAKVSISVQIFIFWPKCRFCTHFYFLVKFRFYTKISIFWPKFRFLGKVPIFVQILIFLLKFRFFGQNFDFCTNLDCLLKFWFFWPKFPWGIFIFLFFSPNLHFLRKIWRFSV